MHKKTLRASRLQDGSDEGTIPPGHPEGYLETFTVKLD